jgi:hypothetical protein
MWYCAFNPPSGMSKDTVAPLTTMPELFSFVSMEFLSTHLQSLVQDASEQ